MDKTEIEKGKTTAVIAYILLIGSLIALSINSEEKNKFASFHIRQGLGLTITFVAIGLIISNFNSQHITVPFWIFISILWSFGIISAIKGEIKEIPLVGRFYQKFFKNL